MGHAHRSIEFQNATIIDGSGASPFPGTVLIDGGRITNVGDKPVGADREIDVEGRYLAPGFIDMHAHSELRLLESPNAPEKLTQGVTLEVLGQDGVSVAPVTESLKSEWQARLKALLGSRSDWPWRTISEFLASLREAEPAVNCAYYAPHGNLRATVAGFDDRELESNELEQLKDRLHAALDQGAFALSTGMIYPPSSFGRDAELIELATALNERNSFMVSHIWNETDRVEESIERYIGICRRGGCQPHVSHLKVGGERNWGGSTAIVDIFDDAERSGLDVTFDQYPYTAGSTMLTALLPPWARQGTADDIQRRLEDAAVRERVRSDIESDGDWENLAKAAGSWDNILITHTASGQVEGQSLDEIAETRATTPVDAMCELLCEEHLEVTMADFIMAEQDIERFLADPRGTICSDGIFGGTPHPRVTGTFARLFERYVRERKALSPELAVYKAAGHPADILGLPDRGRVEVGYRADLVVFDPHGFAENATFESPLQSSDGVEYVLVNGEPAVSEGEVTEIRNGEVLESTDEWGGLRRQGVR